MMNNFMNGMFGKIGSGMCKLSMSGNIAVKTSNGYKSYNVKSGKLTNCGNFVFPGVDENFFFVIPTNKVTKGDIILVNGKPKCVIEADKTKITVINYEDSTDGLRYISQHFGVWREKNGLEGKDLCRTSVALPYKIGCGRGGADWEVIYKIIEGELKDYDVELWRLDE